MTKNDIIKLAREAGLHSAVLLRIYDDKEETLCDSEIAELRKIERFANLVAEREREECAKVCSDASVKLKTFFNLINMHTADVLQDKAAAIRARGTT